VSQRRKTGGCRPSQRLPSRQKPTVLIDEEPLPAVVDYDRALDKALKLLTFRARSRHEIRDRLARAGFAEGVVYKVDARLYELGLLDDSGFAREFADQAMARGLSLQLVRHQLATRGVAPDVVEVVLAEEVWGDLDRALGLARRRAMTYGDLPSSTAFRRLAGYLAQKGYEEEIVTEACYQVLGDPEDAERRGN
jgi:regulatory protein